MTSTKMLALAIASVSFLALAAPTLAQDNADAGRVLPEICKTGAMQHDMGAMKTDMTGMDQAHQDLMKGMDEMNANMMQGGTSPDIDVAFVCSMIPHHQGAIDMARAELAHGDSQWAKDMAQKVIDAQEKEIADMLNWLAEQKH
ncbi:MAG: DUF305 domain-containing protein [Devosia sp.]